MFTRVVPHAQGSWSARGSSGRPARRRVAQRRRHVETAAAVAAEEDEAFAPDVVKANATALFKQVQSAWIAATERRSAGSSAPTCWSSGSAGSTTWTAAGWHNHVEIIGEPTVEYVGLSHHGDQATDSVTVRIEAKLRDYVTDRAGRHLKRAGRLTDTVNVREFWTLEQAADGRWILASIEQGAEGEHGLKESIVATPCRTNRHAGRGADRGRRPGRRPRRHVKIPRWPTSTTPGTQGRPRSTSAWPTAASPPTSSR